MTVSALFVTVVVLLLLVALIKEMLRPGLILLSGAVVFLVAGILSPKEVLEGFSNKGMITVAMLFLISEGVRRSGLLEQLLYRLLPNKNTSIRNVQLRMLPTISFISAFLNNTPVVVIFAPMLKRWAEKMKQPATKLLIPLSYATIVGGMCTLIGTSTNLVVHGMALDEAALHPDSGVRGLSMFELAYIGLPIAIFCTVYILLFSKFLLPDRRDTPAETVSEEADERNFRVEVVLGARFPAIGKQVQHFDFKQKYGATLLEIHRAGSTLLMHDMRKERFREGDTLVLLADEVFMSNWADSSFFLMVSDTRQQRPMGSKKRWFTMMLLALMILGATIGELPSMQNVVPGMKFDMFFFVCLTTIIMAWSNIFPARKYTKFISWDILVTIASAFAISKAMQNSGMADAIGAWAVDFCQGRSPYFLLATVFIIANVFTELMTNNAAAALVFPIAVSMAQHLGVSPMPFIVTICVAASASFCTPIGYQTNLIVQGVGGYKFSDFFKIGLPLNIMVGVINVLLVPIFWPF
ncbi:MAG: SLC13 family permease [Bacteroidaceae bacterium]|nr:SLC13 family permease [Bacteroidaceae bacterium]MBQ5908775.1 SLC13 family permease [Bacteroidaceae bacterium]